MENRKIYPKCYGRECTKNGIVKNKQRYRCKICKYNFIRPTCWKYSYEIRQKAIKLYLEGNGFRRIERLIHVSHMSVVNWVSQLASKIQKIPKKSEKVDILELDEIFINFKKNIWLWTAVNRVTKKLVGFFVSGRSSKSFEKLCENISDIDTKFYTTDKFLA